MSTTSEKVTSSAVNIIMREVYQCHTFLIDELLDGRNDSSIAEEMRESVMNMSLYDLELNTLAALADVPLEKYVDMDEEDIRDDLIRICEDNGHSLEPLEWWCISRDLAKDLKNIDEIVLITSFGCWWGRQTSGQAMIADGIFQEVALMREPESVPEPLPLFPSL